MLVNRSIDNNTVEPHYNKDLGAMKITMLYQGSRSIRIFKKEKKRHIIRMVTFGGREHHGMFLSRGLK